MEETDIVMMMSSINGNVRVNFGGPDRLVIIVREVFFSNEQIDLVFPRVD